MNIKQIQNILIQGKIEPNEAKVEAKMLIRHFLGLSNVDLAMNDEFTESEELIAATKLRAEKRIPIQHIIGYAYFMGEDFIVNENVLIPRDETEILVRKAVGILKNKSTSLAPNQLKVLDIGTGSGCIACMIAKLTNAQVIGVDISTSALQTALENASKLNLNNKAIFRKSDIYSNIHKDEKFDLIVSNPPYIPVSQKAQIQTEVDFEPDSALYAKDEHGIEFYDKIILQAPEFLKKSGHLIFELGIGQALAVKNLMEKQGFKNIEIEKDLAGIERVIIGEK